LMSAHLFITVPHDRANAEHSAAFLHAVTMRGRATGIARQRAQARVAELYRLLYPEGMSFEDPYTPKGVLWTFGLSWRKDIRPQLSCGRLALAQVRELEKRLRTARTFDAKSALMANRAVSPLFAKAAAAVEESDAKLQAWCRFYEKRRRAFKAFVERAVKLKSGIDCGLNL